MTRLEEIRSACKSPDWVQIAMNGGPPCFFIEHGGFCFRAERWPGHGDRGFHPYVSLADLCKEMLQEAS